MKVAFRADASLELGTGHVIRCLTLAEALKAQGVQCQFVCSMQAGNLLQTIMDKGFKATGIEKSTSWQEDAKQTIAVAGETVFDWVVVDHYGLDIKWEQALRVKYKKLMVIDDLADRAHDCDLLLDQNWFGENTAERYTKIISLECNALLGPKYALLKPDFAKLRALMSARSGAVKRILIFMGGSDPSNETSKALHALSSSEYRHLIVDIVLGVNHPDIADIARLASLRPSTSIHFNLPSLAELMARADLMVSAGGSTTWERMCLGLPAIVIGIAENQMATNKAMHGAGYIDFLGSNLEVNVDVIIQAIARALTQPNRLRNMSIKNQNLVFGDGTEQVCELLLSTHE